MVADNAKWHHKAFRALCNRWSYYPPATVDQAAVLNCEAAVVPLENMVTSKRAQFYEMEKPSGVSADDGRYILMTPAGMAAFQPCEFVFSSTKYRLARLPAEAHTVTSTEHGLKTALESILKSTPKSVVKGALRASEHFRDAWLARSQSTAAGDYSLSLRTVEEVIHSNRLYIEGGGISRPNREVGSYESELEILQSMVNCYPGRVRARFRKSDGTTVSVTPEDEDLNITVDSVVIANPDLFKDCELHVKKHWLTEEEASQDPNFVWEKMTNPQKRTLVAVEKINEMTKEIEQLELRSREYYAEKNCSLKSSERKRRVVPMI